jgi:adenylate cyclase class 2
MKEIEAKLLEVDKAELGKKLVELGAVLTRDVDVRALYFDYPDGRLLKSGTQLRLRQIGEVVELSLKEPIDRDGVKTMEEAELTLSDLETAKKILESLAFEKTKELRKHRTTYQLSGVKYEMDTYPDIPTFVEVEGPSKEAVYEAVRRVGYDPADLKPWDAFQLLEHYGKDLE